MDDRYKELNEAFVLLYINSQKDKKASSNRIFISGEDTGIDRWGLSKERMSEYLESGMWDDVNVGNAIETGIQNSGLGLVLIFNFFGGLGGMALVAAFWGIWHIVSGLTVATFWSRRQPVENVTSVQQEVQI